LTDDLVEQEYDVQRKIDKKQEEKQSDQSIE
jgi:hypothetical protein